MQLGSPAETNGGHAVNGTTDLVADSLALLDQLDWFHAI